MFKIVAFDMDGTIADTIPMCIQAFQNSISPYVDHELGEKEIMLTRKEFDLLLLFAENPNKVFTCDQLYDLLWSEQTAYNVDEVVKAHIKSLRQKLSDDDSVQIKNVWGVGYRFCYNRK